QRPEQRSGAEGRAGLREQRLQSVSDPDRGMQRQLQPVQHRDGLRDDHRGLRGVLREPEGRQPARDLPRGTGDTGRRRVRHGRDAPAQLRMHMANTGTIVWAADEAANRGLLEATAGELGLGVRFCTPRDLAGSAETGRGRLIGLEAGADSGRALALIAQVHRQAPRTTILLAARDGSLGFVRTALEAGASDVLALPLERGELHKALLRAIQAASKTAAAPEALGDVITVCGARGGLGATTVAVNLASRLAALTGAETALVDLDLQRGDVAAFLNLTPVNSLANFASAPSEIDELFLASALTRHANGVFVLPAPPEIEDADSVGPDEVKLALDLLRT